MKLYLSREIAEYNERNAEKIAGGSLHKMTYERLAGITMCEYESTIRTKMSTLAKMNQGKMSHPDLDLIWRIATTLEITIEKLINK
jgi:hypothetical protein